MLIHFFCCATAWLRSFNSFSIYYCASARLISSFFSVLSAKTCYLLVYGTYAIVSSIGSSVKLKGIGVWTSVSSFAFTGFSYVVSTGLVVSTSTVGAGFAGAASARVGFYYG